MVFVRAGAFSTGIFRFSIQFAIKNNELNIPTVFFPPILLHPLVEVRVWLMQPADGRLSLLPYLALAQERGWPLEPNHPAFLSGLVCHIAECFQDTLLDHLHEPWILNERMFSYVSFTLTLPRLKHHDSALFERLAQQSASLSNSDASLYDAHSGSNVPGDMDVSIAAHNTHTQAHPSGALPFAPLSDAEVVRIRDHILA